MKRSEKRKLHMRRIKSLMVILAAIIVFVTSYSLILPAITMEAELLYST